MKKATLKYICAYSKMNKPNRVYVPGKEINSTWEDTTPSYAFNDEDGEWFKIDDKRMNKTYDDDNGNSHQLYTLNEKSLINNKTGKTYIITTGRYIIERYLLDDLWETDKVENRYNQPNFLVGKMLPVSYEKMCTMGTAAIWKYIMMAWSYQHNLAIPELIETKKFTGGLSRLLKVGYVDRIVKLDYNSLYPSIILTYGIKSPIDITGVMNALLEYILTQREHYKGLKAQYGKEVDKLKERLKDITDEDELKKINGITDFTPVMGAPLIVPKVNSGNYIVQRGDSLYSIAKKYNTTPQVIATYNGLNVGDYIYPGQEIQLPNKNENFYVVKKDDTINDLLQKLNISIQDLLDLNDNILLKEEQVIFYKKD